MFQDRKEAGKKLAQGLSAYKNTQQAMILAIPRGGIIVGKEVSKFLKIPLDVLVIKKIGYPRNPEFAIGAASTDDYYLNENLIKENLISSDYLKNETKVKQEEAREISKKLRGNKSSYELKDKIIIIVDDGAATGTTLLMALQIVSKQNPKKIIVALPVAHPEAISKFKKIADEVVCLLTPDSLMAVGDFYTNFQQVSIEEAKEYLK